MTEDCLRKVKYLTGVRQQFLQKPPTHPDISGLGLNPPLRDLSGKKARIKEKKVAIVKDNE